MSNDIPPGAIAWQNTASGTTAITTVVTPVVAGRAPFLCGFAYTAVNPTAAVNATVTIGSLTASAPGSGSSMVFQYPTLAAGATAPNPAPLIVNFNSPIPGPPGGISVQGSALGAGGVCSISAWGYLK